MIWQFRLNGFDWNEKNKPAKSVWVSSKKLQMGIECEHETMKMVQIKSKHVTRIEYILKYTSASVVK